MRRLRLRSSRWLLLLVFIVAGLLAAGALAAGKEPAGRGAAPAKGTPSGTATTPAGPSGARNTAAWGAASAGTASPSPQAEAPKAGSEALAPVQAAAQKDLDASLAELAALRARIEAEKLPMMQEMSRLEQKLAALRREYDAAAREQDGLGLEVANSKEALKLRQDEIGYVSNLLDEYARGFDATLHVSEMPVYAPEVEAALIASQNKDLSVTERLERQVGLLKTALARIGRLLGGARYPGDAVNADGSVVKGRFAMIGPVVLFAGEGGGAAGLAMPQTGSTRAVIRPLDEKLAPAATQVITAGTGLLPLDPTRGGALKELVARGNLIGLFRKGGPIMYPLLFLSILAMSVILERLVFLFKVGRTRDPEVVQEIFTAVEEGDPERAMEAGRGSRDFVARALTYALTNREKSLSGALVRASGQEMVRFNRGISILDTVITAAPLLGLLGTVTGMMGSFGMMGGAELSAPAQITGGIAEALIATAFGLGIAVTSLLPLNFLHSRSDEARHEIEDAATHLEVLMKPILDQEAARRSAALNMRHPGETARSRSAAAERGAGEAGEEAAAAGGLRRARTEGSAALDPASLDRAALDSATLLDH
jgi:biopolymer transport protein ExbB